MIFLKILLWAYISSIIFSSVLFSLFIYKAAYAFKKKYPGFKPPEKKHWTDVAFLFAQLGLFMLFPVVNLILGLVILFQYEELCAAVIEKMEEKFHLNQQEE